MTATGTLGPMEAMDRAVQLHGAQRAQTERAVPAATAMIASNNRRLLTVIEALEDLNSRAFSSPTGVNEKTDPPYSGISLDNLQQEITNSSVLLDRLEANLDQFFFSHI